MRWLAGITAGLVVAIAGSYLLMNARTVQVFGGLVHEVETDAPVVALTFDDGPTPAVGEVLDILRTYGARATFFVTGAEVAEHPGLAERIVDAGHELGNHSWSHERMVLRPRGWIADEIGSTDERILAAGQPEPIHVRPPYGKKLVGLPRYLAANDRLTIMWSIEPDSDPAVASDPSRIVETVMEQVTSGSIILLHVMYEGNAPSRAALPELLERLDAEGYELLTVSELLEHGEA